VKISVLPKFFLPRCRLGLPGLPSRLPIGERKKEE